jgi:hypothetical protein
MPSNFRTPYLAAPEVHTLPSHLPLGELGLLPVNAHLITGGHPATTTRPGSAGRGAAINASADR